jgi:hypothetical protein
MHLFWIRFNSDLYQKQTQKQNGMLPLSNSLDLLLWLFLSVFDDLPIMVNIYIFYWFYFIIEQEMKYKFGYLLNYTI